MYNRYKPQKDGTYQKTTHPDRISEQQPAAIHDAAHFISPIPPEDICAPEPENIVSRPVEKNYKPNRQSSKPRNAVVKKEPASAFLRGLLPKNLDTGDLLVIILLLLIAGDCSDDQGSILLTLALYLYS